MPNAERVGLVGGGDCDQEENGQYNPEGDASFHGNDEHRLHISSLAVPISPVVRGVPGNASAQAPRLMASKLLASEHASSPQNSRGDSMDLLAEKFNRGPSSGSRWAAPECGVVARRGRIVQRAYANLSLKRHRDLTVGGTTR